MEITGGTSLTQFPGVGEARAKKLEKLGLTSAGDLLTWYPRDYEDRRKIYTIRDAPPEGRVCVTAMAAEHPRLSRIRKGLELVQVKVVDDTGALHLTFFNQSYLERAIKAGEEYIFYGSVEVQGRRRTMVNPIFERVDRRSFTGCIMPVYRLTAGISNHLLASLTRQALTCAGEAPETLPQHIRQEHSLAAAEFSLKNIHFPEDEEALSLARRRLAFEELFYLAVGLSFLKDRRGREGDGFPLSPRLKKDFLSLLPFAPTQAQSRVMDEVAADLTSGRPMNRLVQGDVGSGKTAVAAYAGWLCAGSGCQTALMAPTEVLAEQHFKSLSQLLAPAGVRVGLLTGSMPAAEKKRTRAALASGEIDFAVGTHALIDQGVAFRRLALIIYGDRDVSVIDQLPPGRTPIATYVVREDKRQRMYGFVRKQTAEGRQVYIVCPAVEENPDAALPGEESPALNLKAVKTYAEKLQKEVFPDLRVGLLHGKMKPREKEAAMSAFASGETQVLVATTVVEVGVDVPNASLIIIENADRFGLSQLHQLRGRVGRGEHPSHCVLITGTRSLEAMERLHTLASTTDGFKISEEDLKVRGPGDFFGNRQHGLPQMKLADLAGDMRLLSEAQEAARSLLEQDPQLSQPENRPVWERVRRLFADTPDIFN